MINSFKNKLSNAKEKIDKKKLGVEEKKEDIEKEKEEQAKQKKGKKRRIFLLIILYIVDAILTVIETAIAFLIAHLAFMMLLLIIIIIILSMLLSWMFDIMQAANANKGNTDDNSSSYSEDIGGTDNMKKTAWSEYELLTRGSQLSNQDKNMYRLIMLFNNYQKDPTYAGKVWDLHLLLGQGYTESGYAFFADKGDVQNKNVLTDPITNLISGYIGPSGKSDGYGGMFGCDLADIIWSGNYTSKTYTPIDDEYKSKAPKSISCLTDDDKAILAANTRTEEYLMQDAYMPYAVQKLMIMSKTWWSLEDNDAYKTMAKEALDAVGLKATDENIELLMQLASVRRTLNSSSEYEKGSYYFNAMVMASAADNDGNVSLSNWSYYTVGEPSMRTAIVGIKSDDAVTSFDDFSTSKYFTLKGKSLNCTVWQYFKKTWGTNDWFKEMESDVVSRYNGNTADVHNIQYALMYHYGLARWVSSEICINDIVSQLTGAALIESSEYGVGELRSDSFALPFVNLRGITVTESGITMGCNFGFDNYNYNTRAGDGCRFHDALDITAPNSGDCRILAACGKGTVTNITYNDVYTGNSIVIEYENGWKSTFLHMEYIEEGITEGMSVTENTIVGKMGDTGDWSTGAHLHWKISKTATSGKVFVLNPSAVCQEVSVLNKGCVKNVDDWVAAGRKKELFDASKASGYTVYYNLADMHLVH